MATVAVRCSQLMANTNQITFVTGSYPPDVCGVGDYTHSLVSALDQLGVRSDLFYKRDWSLVRFPEYWSKLRRSTTRSVVIEYPTEGYGYSIVPQLLCMLLSGKRRIVNLHEFSQKSFSGKVAIYSFFLFANCLIFTSETEYRSAVRLAPWLSKKSFVSPIGSNIPFHPCASDAANRNLDIVYFGQIRPRKGIEEFLRIVANVQKRVRHTAALIGQTVPAYKDYAAFLVQQANSLGIEVALNLNPDQVSQRLSAARIGLLPFPDGISPRRGSALAVMGNGALLLTTSTQMTEERFSPVSLLARDPSFLSEIAVEALLDYPRYESIRQAGIEYARTFSWPEIARRFYAASLPKGHTSMASLSIHSDVALMEDFSGDSHEALGSDCHQKREPRE